LFGPHGSGRYNDTLANTAEVHLDVFQRINCYLTAYGQRDHTYRDSRFCGKLVCEPDIQSTSLTLF